MRPSGFLVAGLGLAVQVRAHGDHGHGGSQKPIVGENASWMEKHMAGKNSQFLFVLRSVDTLPF
jgi:hypothetical protein